MSDYSKLTNFAVKDGYTSGTPAKVIKGTELDDEFNAIATAVATKYDSGDSTELRSLVGALLYPVGSIYINATNSANPSSLLGFGTWTAFGAGRVPVGFDATDSLFDSAEETGGSKDATVVSHSHTATSTSSVTDPGHNHTYYLKTGTGSYQSAAGNENNGVNANTSTATTGISVSTSTTISSAGSSGTNANLQPYITVYMWKRTA
jgi:hypothetical protein